MASSDKTITAERYRKAVKLCLQDITKILQKISDYNTEARRKVDSFRGPKRSIFPTYYEGRS